MKRFAAIAVLFSALLTACEAGSDLKGLEDRVRAEVVKESAGIASLEAIYLVSYMYFQQNWITSDDVYIQKDTVSIDYGFRLDDNCIHVIADGPRKILQVRLKKGEALATNRATIDTPETTHSGYRPKDPKTGVYIDVDAAMNREIDAVKKEYEDRNLKTAEDNIRNFFKIMAAKYDLELDFMVL